MAKTADKPRQGTIQYSVEKVRGEEYSHIMRSDKDDKEAVALYDAKAGIVEMLKGKESYRVACITHLNNTGQLYKECCKLGTDIKEVPAGAPPMPKKSRIQGEKTVKLVEWFAKYRPDFFLDKYRVTQMQVRDRIDVHTRQIREESGKIVEEKYEVPVYENVDGFDFNITSLKSGEQRLIGHMKTHLTETSKDGGDADEYDDELDQAIMAESGGDE